MKIKLVRCALKYIIFIAVLIFSGELHAQDIRVSYSLSSTWDFHQGVFDISMDPHEVTWEKISLPHTWNAEDVVDEPVGYYRGEGWYLKRFTVNESKKNSKAFLHFKGANQETEVFVNGKAAGKHIGGYSAFNIHISPYLKYGEENEVLIKVNNRFHEDIPTLTADFTFFGGIYRDLFLTFTNEVHFSMDRYGSSGVLVSTPHVSEEKAEIAVKGELINESDSARRLEVLTLIKNAEHKIVAKKSSSYRAKAGERIIFNNAIRDFKDPKLWSIEDPYLYQVVTQIRDGKAGEVLDEISSSLGLRWFRFDPAEGFFLNGKSVKLIGTNRHQDYEGLGNALPRALHVRDVDLVKGMGANFLRIAHYPQDPSVLEACDRLGIITSVEIPIVNTITESEAFADNCEEMMREMILQDYNHPSVVIWAYMNEVLLRPKFADDPERQQTYFQNIAALARRLENVARELDPYRYTMIPNHGAFERYKEVGLTKIPMIVGWNLYQGWYGGDIHGFARFLDKHRKELPDKPVIVTEYGAGADPRLRSSAPERFDQTIEYQTYYHQVYIEAILERPFVAGVNVWNLADFSSEGRVDAVPHINSKGLLTYGRVPKDAYYLYQSYLLERPFIAIGSKLWSHRSGMETSPGSSQQKIEIFTNQENASLFLNGESLGKKDVVGHIVSWDVPFKAGENLLEVVAGPPGKIVKDFHKVHFKLLPGKSDSRIPFTDLLVNLGDRRYFVDDLTKEVWLPSQEYTAGGWGTISGKPFKLNPSPRQSYGTDQAIMGTNNDPLYQTQQVGLESFRADVPQGKYELTLHFAELVPEEERKALAYNLDKSESVALPVSDRVFDVYVNKKLVLEEVNLADHHGRESAAAYKMATNVISDQGIVISLKAKTGEPILNAVEIRKIY